MNHVSLPLSFLVRELIRPFPALENGGVRLPLLSSLGQVTGSKEALGLGKRMSPRGSKAHCPSVPVFLLDLLVSPGWDFSPGESACLAQGPLCSHAPQHLPGIEPTPLAGTGERVALDSRSGFQVATRLFPIVLTNNVLGCFLG